MTISFSLLSLSEVIVTNDQSSDDNAIWPDNVSQLTTVAAEFLRVTELTRYQPQNGELGTWGPEPDLQLDQCQTIRKGLPPMT